MLSISSILKYILDGVKANSERFKVLDDQHIVDMNTGVKLHLYDNYFKISHDGKTIVRMSDFAPEEQEVIWQIKQHVTDPVVAQEMMTKYPLMLKQRRIALSNLFENPKPLVIKEPVLEDDTTEYTG